MFSSRFFNSFLQVIFVQNTRCLVSQMNPTKKNMTNLDLNRGQLVHQVPNWVGFCMAQDCIQFSHFLLLIRVMVMEGHLLSNHELSQNLCDSKLQNFCAQNFQLQNYFALNIFENVVVSKVFTFTFCCAMFQRAPLGDIWCPSDGVEYIEAPCNVSLWYYGPCWFTPVQLSIF